MGRHQIPRHLRRRLVAAGTAAVCILGTAVGIGIYGAAQADDVADARPVQCLPEVPPPASSEVVPPPDESAPPEEPPAEEPPVEEPPAEEPPAEEPPAEEPPAEEPPADENPEEPPADEPPADEPPADEPPADEPPADEPPAEQGEEAQSFGLTSPQGARPRGEPTQEPPAEQPPGEEAPEEPPAEEPPAEEPPAEEPPAEEPPAEEPPAEEPPADDDSNEEGPPPAETVPPVPPDAPEDDFGNENCTDELGPFAQDFVSIFEVEPNNLADSPAPGANASTGTFVSDCGTNENEKFNSDNLIAAPGKVNAAEHTHSHVGNLDTNAGSTDESLLAAGTTCENQADKSSYYWPVLRVRNADGNGAADDTNAHNTGEILRASTVLLEFRGNAQSDVVAMPPLLKVLTGNSKAETNDNANTNAKWTCSGFEDRITDKYPLCPRGSQVMRIADFPSCSDGNTDSANHRDHIVFPDEAGACPEGTQAVPQLRITLSYDVPRGRVFALDAFPAELHSPRTDHNDFINVMSEDLMNEVVSCINSGRNC